MLIDGLLFASVHFLETLGFVFQLVETVDLERFLEGGPLRWTWMFH